MEKKGEEGGRREKGRKREEEEQGRERGRGGESIRVMRGYVIHQINATYLDTLMSFRMSDNTSALQDERTW